MTMRHRLRSGSARRGFATITSAAMLLAMMAVPATAEHFENTDVLDADNAVEAAVNWSQFTFDSATDVALGRNDKFPDNLASSVIQGTETPLLYTDGDSLSEETAAELDRLGAETVHVLGGDEAISEDVVDELEALGLETHRDAGTTRIETAIDIAATHAADATHALIVRAFGDDGGDETRAWADALGAGGWAAEEGWPVLLTQTLELNDNVADYIEGSDITSATIIGGTSAVSAQVASDLEALGVDVDRVSGSNRFATAVAIAAARGFDDAGDADTVILSEGQQSDAWAGGFAAAAYSAISGAPIVLSNGENLPPETVEFLEGSTDGSVALVCGPFVEPEACDEAATILGQEEAAHTNQSFTVTPAEDVTQTEDTSRQYTVSGITSDMVDIVLFECEEVNVDDEGVVTFQDDNTNNSQADRGTTTGATITVINGVSGASGDEVGVNDGSVTFTVTSTDDVCVQPVVFDDANGNDQLDLNAQDVPTEPFGIGGETDFIPAEAAGGPFGVDVDRVEKDADYFTGSDAADATGMTATNTAATNAGTFYYDSNDNYSINGAPVTMAVFEQNLSVDDRVEGTYATDPALTSTFNLFDDAPEPPDVATAEAEGTTITVTVTDPSDTPDVDTYNVYRAPANLDNVGAVTGCPDFNTAGTADRGRYTQVGTIDADATTLEYEDTGLAENTTYCYFVTSVANGDESAEGEAADDDATEGVETGTVADTGRPTITDSRLTTDAGLQTIVDQGDTWRITFSENMDDTTATAGTFVLTDADGDRFTVNCAAEEGAPDLTTTACTLGPDTSGNEDRILTILIGGDDVVDQNSTVGDNILEYPVTITTTDAEVQDDGGNVVDLANSADIVIDTEA